MNRVYLDHNATTPLRPEAPAGSRLTPRELEILTLITAGMTNGEIVEKLNLSINSIKTYIRQAYRKIDVERRTQAVSPESVRPVIIEDDVWIGTQAKIMPGVKIGRGAIVATGSVVTRDVPPMSVVAGAPARFVRRVNANDRVEHIPRARAPRDTEARSTTTRAGKTFARAETAR